MRPLSRTLSVIVMAAALVSLAAILSSQPVAPKEQVGPLADGGFLLNSGWRLDPAGKQVPLDTLPMSTALSPDGKYLLVLHCGYRPPSIAVLDAATGAVVGTTPVPDGWLGLAFAPQSDRVYVGGGARAAVFEFTLADGKLTAGRTFQLATGKPTPNDFIGDVAFSPDGRLLYAAELYHDSIAVINPQSGMVIDRIRRGDGPIASCSIPTANRSSSPTGPMARWGTTTPPTAACWRGCRVGAHPTDMVWRAGANTEAVEGEPAGRRACLWPPPIPTTCTRWVSARAKSCSVVESINVSMTPRQPLGMTPSGLALSPDGSRLYVACSDANAAAVVDVSGERSHVEGFIPTGWYPTAVRVLPSGTLVVLNGKGVRSYPNPQGPNPARRPEPVHAGLAERAVRGAHADRHGVVDRAVHATASSTPGPRPRSPIRPIATASWMRPAPLPPIQHVIYIVKENRTYDQVLGDMKEGNGDPRWCCSAKTCTPNLHKLAREFVLLDNFYVNADVSADGHNWSTAAIAPDYVAEAVAERVRPPRQGVRLRRAGPGLAAARRLSVDQRQPGRASAFAISATWWTTREGAPMGAEQIASGARPGAGQSDQPHVSAASTWTTRTSSGPRSFLPSWPSTKRAATCRG